MGLIMASYMGLYGILSGLTKSTDHPSKVIYVVAGTGIIGYVDYPDVSIFVRDARMAV